MTVAVLNKVGGLFCRLCVDDPAKSRWLAGLALRHTAAVCDHADQHSTDPSCAANHFLGKVRLKFVNRSVENAVKHRPHVVRSAMIGGQKLVKYGAGSL